MSLEISSQIDGLDREILRVLQKRRPLVSRQIAKSTGLSSVAIMPRLSKLKGLGVLKISKKTKNRVFKRSFGKKTIEIKSPRSIYWDFDFKDE
jgi:DNA-binding Lrp family transcriptional regulator